MRTYISPIGYDTRRVTKPVVSEGFDRGDRVHLLRPAEETDRERAARTIADVEQFLQEIEPGIEVTVERVGTESFEATVGECCRAIDGVGDGPETIVALGGGARDVLLPLTVAALVYANRIDTALFFSDLNSAVREWPLPDLTARPPERTGHTLGVLVAASGWQTLSALTEATDLSKSTVIRHVQELETAGVVESETTDREKRVRVTFTGELLALATGLAPA